jgi:Putative Ig domain.
VTIDVYGGSRFGSTPIGTGNKLELIGSGLNIGGDIKGFQKLDFDLSNSGTAITVIGTADITNAEVSISDAPAALNAGDAITLIEAGTLTSTPANTTASGGGYNWNLSVSDNKLIATVAPPATAPTITTASLPSGQVGTAYSQTLTATGTTPITWTVDSGFLPAGVSLNNGTGVISGTPTTAGTATFSVKAANGTSPNATQSLNITVAATPVPPSGGSSSGGGSTYEPSTPIITTAKQPDLPKTATTTINGTVQGGNVTTTITNIIVQNALSRAGTDPDGIALIFNINGNNFTGQVITIEAAALQRLVSSGVKYAQVETGIFRFSLDAAALTELNKQTTGTVTISVTPVPSTQGSHPTFDITIKDSTGKSITNLGSGEMMRGIAYTPTASE